jgi:16S rRNA pseudouridine516 synthase
MALMRLDRLIASQLNLSRTDAARLLSSGAVTVDGLPARRGGERVDPQSQKIAINGRRLVWRRHLYILMNKPQGVVCSTRDPDSKTVLDLLSPELARRGLFPAGRLDKYSEGMLIITDDGALAHRMLSPKSRIPKVYEVTVDRPVVGPALIEIFSRGVDLGGGDVCSPAILEPLSPTDARVTIFEGIYHQIRRMFARQGAAVTRLVRVQIGLLPLDPALPSGGARLMTDCEVKKLTVPCTTED